MVSKGWPTQKKHYRTYLQEGDKAVEALLKVAHAQGQGVDEHTLLQGLSSGEGSTHKAAELAQQLGPDVANEQCLAPVGVQGMGRLASSAAIQQQNELSGLY
jgi:hypothetical protein